MDPISNQVFSFDYEKFVLQKDHCIINERHTLPRKPFDINATKKTKKSKKDAKKEKDEKNKQDAT